MDNRLPGHSFMWKNASEYLRWEEAGVGVGLGSRSGMGEVLTRRLPGPRAVLLLPRKPGAEGVVAGLLPSHCR